MKRTIPALLTLMVVGLTAIAPARAEDPRFQLFNQICANPLRSEDCSQIGKAAYVSTQAIYQLYQLEEQGDVANLNALLDAIRDLYKAEEAFTINARIEPEQILGSLDDLALLKDIAIAYGLDQDQVMQQLLANPEPLLDLRTFQGLVSQTDPRLWGIAAWAAGSGLDTGVLTEERQLGGYALILRREKLLSSRPEISYVVVFKGLLPDLEDPNDIAASLWSTPIPLSQTSSSPLVHSGFRSYANQVLKDPQFQSIVTELKQPQSFDQPEISILVAGHSLGGAAAFLHSLLLADAGVPPDRISGISFGAPPVGQDPLQSIYSDIKFFRVEHRGDFFTYDDLSPLKPAYEVLQYKPIGEPIVAEITETLSTLIAERHAAEITLQQQPDPETVTAYLDLTRQVIDQQVQIHTQGYNYYFEHYDNTLGWLDGAIPE